MSAFTFDGIQIDKSADEDFMVSIHGEDERVSHLSTAVEIPGRKGRNSKMITKYMYDLCAVFALPWR